MICYIFTLVTGMLCYMALELFSNNTWYTQKVFEDKMAMSGYRISLYGSGIGELMPLASGVWWWITKE